MVEPVSITLASIGLFIRILDPVKKAYEGYKLTAAFGVDFDATQRRLYISYVRLDTISKTKLSWLQYTDVMDEGSELNKAIVEILRLISLEFEACNKLMKNYHDKEKEAIEKMDANFKEPVTRGDSSAEGSLMVPLTNEANVKSQNRKHKDSDLLHRMLPSLFKKKPRKKLGSEAGSAVIDPSMNPSLRRVAGGDGTDVTIYSSARLPDENRNASNQTSEDMIAERQSTTPLSATPSNRSPSTTPSSATLPSSALLSSALTSMAVQKRKTEAEEHATQLQDTNNAWRRIKWADHDRDAFNLRLKSLRDYITDLEALVHYKEVQDPSSLLLQSSDWTGASEDEKSRLALKRLHNALASINPMKSLVGLSIQVIEDPENQADEFSSQDGSPSLSPGSLLSVFQARPTGAETSLLLYSETMTSQHSQNPQSGQPEAGSPLQDLSVAMSRLDASDVSQECRVVGQISIKESFSDHHRLFSPALGSWVSCQTLATYLDRKDFKNRITEQQRFQIARLLAISFLHFAAVNTITGQYPRPDRVIYYTPATSNPDVEPNILNPYLSIGFGSKKPPKWPGMSSGLANERVNPVVELGLLLYQIGSGSTLNYGSGVIGVMEAKSVALRTIHKVDRLSSGSFAELVILCLGWRDSTCAPVEPRDYVFIDRIRHSLKAQEERMLI